MPRVADFVVIQDYDFTLNTSIDATADFNFNLGSGPLLDQQSILAFTVTVPPNTLVSVFQVKIEGAANPPEEYNYTIAKGSTTTYSIHEILGKNTLKNSGNKISFRVLPGLSPVTIGDVVVHYSRNI